MTQSIDQNINLDYELRYAHIDGHTELDFIPNDKNEIITSGVDCEIRTWSLLPELDGVLSSYTVEDVPYSVLATENQAFVALTNNFVKSFQLDELGDDEKVICRFSSNVTCLSLHYDHELLAIGSGDFAIKVVNLDDLSKMKIFEGHEGPILSLSMDPLRKYLASSSCDGSVLLWSIESPKVFLHKWSKQLPKSNDFDNSSSLCRICWEPKFGKWLAIPGESCIDIYNRGQWDKPACKIEHPKLCGLVSIVCTSSDGQFIAASTASKSVMIVWRVDNVLDGNFQPISIMYNGDNSITCLKFNPKDSQQLCSADNGGCLKIIKIKNDKTSISSTKTSATDKTSKKTDPIISQKTMNDVLADFEMDDLDDSDFNSLSIIGEKKTKTSDEIEKKLNIDTQLSKTNEEKDRFKDFDNHPVNIEQDSVFDHSNVDVTEDAEEFDISAIKSKYEPLIFGDEMDNEGKVKSSSTIPSKMSGNTELVIDGHRITGNDLLKLVRGPRYQPPTRQPPFQSGSTPIHYQNRFMVWNSVGIVYSYNTNEEHSIDVEFHDLTFHHSIHMVNMFNYTMADLSASCLLLASNGDDMSYDELDHQKARLFCQQFNSWDQVKEWQVDLADKEQFDCITAGQTFVAALTNLRYLRIWTIGGVQTMIRSIDGPSINLSSYDNFLMVLYHSACHHTEDGQSVSCLALKIDHRGKTRAHPIPSPFPVALSPKATVYWAGFTDEGTPCVVDSDGIVRVYKNHFGNGWFPICATKQHANGKSDNFFIIGLSEIHSQVRCIFCKASRYPDTVPKPTLQILPLQIPLCELNNEPSAKSKHEEECLRSRWLVSLLKRLSLDGFDVEDALDQSEKQIINSLIKLFALSLGAERESLALEVAKLLPNSQALEGAIHYAERQRHRSLAMKLVEMIQEGGPEEADKEAGEEPNSDEELQELMTKKQADRLRQLLKDNNSHSSTTMISLAKYDEDNSTNSNFTTLKPKSLKNGENNSSSTAIETIHMDDDELNSDNEDLESIDQLKPKKLKKIDSTNQKNPFKIQNSNSRKRKLNEVETAHSDEEPESDNSQESDLEVLEDENFNSNVEDLDSDPGFMFFFEENRLDLFQEFNDQVETEEELVQLAKQKYQQLSKKQHEKWTKKALKSKKDANSKKRTKAEKEKTTETSKSQNKITNFFIKKT